MKRKIIIAATFMWLFCIVGGGAWARFEQYFQQRSITPAQREIQSLQQLYRAQLFEELLRETDRAMSDKTYINCEPDVLFIRWASYERLGKMQEADRTKQLFLERHPRHALAAELHYNNAMNLLAIGKYGEAERELTEIKMIFANTAVCGDVSELLGRLHSRERIQ